MTGLGREWEAVIVSMITMYSKVCLISLHSILEEKTIIFVEPGVAIVIEDSSVLRNRGQRQ